jgi:predicted amidohydrolase YtcJ
VGSLEVGKHADPVVLGDDPARIHPEGIAEISIEQTLLAGRGTHAR